MKRINPKDYYCSKHGEHGRIECDECCANLLRLTDDHNINLVMDDAIKRQFKK